MIHPSWAEDQAESCVCDYKQPILRCVVCGMPNRAGSMFCRGCRGTMPAKDFSGSRAQARPADFVSIRGSFRRPPLAAGGFLYGISASGAISRVSPRSEAKPLDIGDIGEGSAGINHSALVNVAGNSGVGIAGWTLLTATTSAVLAMPLVTAKVLPIYEPRTGREVGVNRPEADCTGFRGVAGTSEFCAFTVDSREGDFLLTLKFFSKDRPISQPVAIHGSQVAGPALHQGTLILCSDKEAAVYDVTTQKFEMMQLPVGFDPLLRPSSPQLSVSPGSIPMVAWRMSDKRLVGRVAGVQQGIPGVLEIDFSGKVTQFRSIPSGSAICTNADGSLSLSLLDRVERIGIKSEILRTAPLQPGMPACVGDRVRCWFLEEAYDGKHRIAVSLNSRQIELAFEDTSCTGNTCYGIYDMDGEMLVAYSDQGMKRDDVGMRFAHWPVYG